MNSLTEFIIRYLFLCIKIDFHRVHFIRLLTSLNKKEAEILNKVLKLSETVYYNHYYFDILNLHNSILLVEEDKLEKLLLHIYDKIFDKRISWYRIFVYLNIVIRFKPSLIPKTNFVIYELLFKIMKNKLEPWIEEQNQSTIENDEPDFIFPNMTFHHIVPERRDAIVHKCNKKCPCKRPRTESEGVHKRPYLKKK